MTEHIRQDVALLIGTLALTAALAAPARAQEDAVPAASAGSEIQTDSAEDSAPTRFVLTRTGVVWEGRLVDRGESYGIVFPSGGSVTASKLDVLFIGDTRESVLAYKVSVTPMEDVNEVLKLADWASRRQLGAAALAVLTERLADSVDDAERRALQKKIDELALAEKFRADASRAVAEFEDRKLAQNAAASQVSNKKKATNPVDSELDAWGKTLPPAALERFSRSALPAIQKRCATSGCHEVGTPGARYVVRPKAIGPAQRLALLFDLRETLVYVDFDNVDASPILNHPTVANERGERVYPFGSDRYSVRDCANFVEWLNTLKGEPKLVQAALEYRARRDDAPALREGAASRYDVLDVTNSSNASAPNPDASNASIPAPQDENPDFAGLFDEPAATPADLSGAPFADPSKPVFQQGFSKDSEKFMPNPYDDVNSTESTLRRVGMAPRKTYRDEYDPAIFNDRYHTTAPTAADAPNEPGENN